jgi:calcineurin-like phosphoesterase family protein
MNKIWFTSDTHFGHANIIKHADRPFYYPGPGGNPVEMDEALIENWNRCVQKGDRVYHLGDIALSDRHTFMDLRRRLNGQIYLIRGNHEKTADSCPEAFLWIKDYFKLKVDDNDTERGRQEVVLFHYPIASWDKHHHGAWHLHGHCHSNHNPWKASHMPKARSFDIGVDSVALYLANGGPVRKEDFRPLDYEEVKAFMKSKQGENVDHHAEETPA